MHAWQWLRKNQVLLMTHTGTGKGGTKEKILVKMKDDIGTLRHLPWRRIEKYAVALMMAKWTNVYKEGKIALEWPKAWGGSRRHDTAARRHVRPASTACSQATTWGSRA